MLGVENRLRLISFAILAVALFLTSRLYMVQLVHGDVYESKAEHQYVAGNNYFDRGSIFFTTKDGEWVPAASVKTGFTPGLPTRAAR